MFFEEVFDKVKRFYLERKYDIGWISGWFGSVVIGLGYIFFCVVLFCKDFLLMFWVLMGMGCWFLCYLSWLIVGLVGGFCYCYIFYRMDRFLFMLLDEWFLSSLLWNLMGYLEYINVW